MIQAKFPTSSSIIKDFEYPGDGVLAEGVRSSDRGSGRRTSKNKEARERRASVFFSRLYSYNRVAVFRVCG